MRRLSSAALALKVGERVLLVAELLLRRLAIGASLVEVSFVVLDLGLELVLRVCTEARCIIS